MGRSSTVKRLPEEVRDVINALRNAGRTIDEILQKLRELDVDVSRSALGRYTQEIDAIAADIRQARIVSSAIMERFGEETDSKTARLNLELAHGLVLRLMQESRKEGGAPLDAKELMFLGTTLEKLIKAKKTDQDAVLQIRREMAKQAATAAETAGKAQGLTADTIDAIKRQILGVGQ